MAPTKQVSIKDRNRKVSSKKKKAKLAITKRWKKVDNNRSVCENSNTEEFSRPMPELCEARPNLPSTSVSDSHNVNSSETNDVKLKEKCNVTLSDLEKCLLDVDPNPEGKEDKSEPDYKIIDKNCLSNLFTNLICPECNKPSLVINAPNRVRACIQSRSRVHKLCHRCTVLLKFKEN